MGSEKGGGGGGGNRNTNAGREEGSWNVSTEMFSARYVFVARKTILPVRKGKKNLLMHALYMETSIYLSYQLFFHQKVISYIIIIIPF